MKAVLGWRTILLLLAVTGLGLVLAVRSMTPSGPSGVLAVEPGVNCSSYTGAGGVCVIEVGDIWFCDASFQDGVCGTSVAAGDRVRWEYPASGQLVHTATECGADCDAPTSTPLWDSGILQPGDSFEITLTEPDQYLYYYCQVHPTAQRGLIRVLEPPSTPTPAGTRAPTPTRTPTPPGRAGDVNCDSNVTSIDAALVLQREAGLLMSLRCQQNADVNGDGRTNSLDAVLILQYDAGLLDQLPV